jgi:VCBS repeat-containing protein
MQFELAALVEPTPGGWRLSVQLERHSPTQFALGGFYFRLAIHDAQSYLVKMTPASVAVSTSYVPVVTPALDAIGGFSVAGVVSSPEIFASSTVQVARLASLDFSGTPPSMPVVAFEVRNDDFFFSDGQSLSLTAARIEGTTGDAFVNRESYVLATYSASAAAWEDSSPLIGQLTGVSSASGERLTYSLVGTEISGLNISSDGSWSFDPSDYTYQSLGSGKTKTFVVTYRVVNQRGADDVGSFTITLSGANDAPSGASKSVVTLEDSAYTFGLSDFGFSDIDEGDSLAAVRIDTLPTVTAGVLRLGTVAVSTLQVVDSAELVDLRFEPAADTNGTALANFTFSVRDASAFDIAPKVMTINVSSLNDAPVGAVTIEGTPTQGQTLKAHNTLTDADGLGVIHYQWKADGIPISDATGSIFTLTQAQVGRVITVTASYTDGGGQAETVTSPATSEVAPATISRVLYHWKSHAVLSEALIDSILHDDIGLPPDISTAISSADAMAALKITLGRNPNPDPDGPGPRLPLPVSPYQLFAADINADGVVSRADAELILRLSLGVGGTVIPSWLFASETADLSAVTRTNSGIPATAAIDPVAEGLLDNVVVILRGDVDGSWRQAGESEVLPIDYFQALVEAQIGSISMEQFGIGSVLAA